MLRKLAHDPRCKQRKHTYVPGAMASQNQKQIISNKQGNAFNSGKAMNRFKM